MNCSYSVVIRTLGNSGWRYKKLIDAIKAQSLAPEEIIVVLPYGYDLDYRYGDETVVFCEKGMVSQRAEGIKRCRSEYMLVVDDDVEFAPSMVEDLFQYAIDNKLDCCLPMEGDSSDTEGETIVLGLPLMTRIRGAFTGQVFTSRRRSEFLDKITVTAGHKIFLNSNKKDKCYLVQCGCFQCFFIKTDVAKNVHFEDETWLEEGTITQYASYDDPTFYYKLYLQGGRIAYSLRTRYRHLDAAAGRKAKTPLESKIIRYYSVARNRTIFWYKFLWKQPSSFWRKVQVLAGGIYGFVNYTLWSTLICLRPKYWGAVKALFSGYIDACHGINQMQKFYE